MIERNLILGVDLDNTIVCYDGLFHRVAVEEGLISPSLPTSKTAVRDILRAERREKDWTRLQGLVYGPRMNEAPPFPGVFDFFTLCRNNGLEPIIISHRTRYPYLGPRFDLHRFARNWIQRYWTGEPLRLFLEPSKAHKLKRISAEGCTHFIDDLPEFLNEPGFPSNVKRFLFDPHATYPAGTGVHVIHSWPELVEWFFSCSIGTSRSNF